MEGRRGRKVHVVEVDGVARNAYSTSLTFSLTLDDLMHAIAVAATSTTATATTATTPPDDDDHFDGALAHNPVAREWYWSERDTEAARLVADRLGPGRIYATARAELRANGESWRNDDWTDRFPPEVARRRAEELFPMLRSDGNPFAPAPDVLDR